MGETTRTFVELWNLASPLNSVAESSENIAFFYRPVGQQERTIFHHCKKGCSVHSIKQNVNVNVIKSHTVLSCLSHLAYRVSSHALTDRLYLLLFKPASN